MYVLTDIIILVLSLAVILTSCELFTNAIEWLGKKLKVGDGVIGSIFSAVGTCLPETTIPVIAILFSTDLKSSVDIGMGAIVGAPFMLGTLAFFVTGLSVLAFWKKRKTGMVLNVNHRILSRDIKFFIIVYTVGIAVSFVRVDVIRYLVSIFLIACYVYYVILTVRHDKESHNELENLYISRIFRVGPNIAVISMQLLVALAGIILGAKFFVISVEDTSSILGISALALSLIMTPIATELPEKFNSIIWIRKRKDTLALGNITGAMVFQSCIPVSIGILATSWELDLKLIISAAAAILSAALTLLWIRVSDRLTALPLLTGGVFYAAFIAFLVMRGFR